MQPKIQSEADFQKAFLSSDLRFRYMKIACKNCNMPFSNLVIYTPEGWAQSQVDGLCEDCREDLITNMTGDIDE